jgi:Tfp pilus assembly protein PilF
MELKTAAQLFQKGDLVQAQQLADKAIKAEPQNANAYALRAFLFIKSKDAKKAIEYSDKAIALDKKCVDAYLVRGLARSSLSKSGASLTDFSEAMKLKPNYSDAYFYRALAYFSMERKKEALTDLDKAQAIDKSDSNLAIVMVARGTIYLFYNDFDKALSNIDSALKIEPNNAKALE